MQQNIILATDSYKLTHYRMYPPGLEYMHSYFEPRQGGEYDRVLFFGLQYFIQEYLDGFVVTEDKINQAEAFSRAHFGADYFNREGWEHILNTYHGHLPVEIHAVPEGTVVPESNVLFSITNLDPKVPWLTNHLETMLVQVWYPTTVATISYHLRMLLEKSLRRTGRTGSSKDVGFKLHDFGLRGSTSMESAALGGAAHLVSFVGTDNLAACQMLAQYYDGGVAGVSVPAAEHSTVTTWGEDRETEAYQHILEQYPDGLVSVVSDSWDIFKAVEQIWGQALYSDVMDRKGVLVIRPDSGDPLRNLLHVLGILAEQFPTTMNEKGYRMLPDQIRLIQGDGITRRSLTKIVTGLEEAGWSLDNLVFGSGGGLLQDCNRDTQRFAFKASYAQVDGQPRAVRKNPQSDLTKASKAGLLSLEELPDGRFRTVSDMTPLRPGGHDGNRGLLECVYSYGKMRRFETLEQIRRRMAHYLEQEIGPWGVDE